jgi:hypothetical protein
LSQQGGGQICDIGPWPARWFASPTKPRHETVVPEALNGKALLPTAQRSLLYLFHLSRRLPVIPTPSAGASPTPVSDGKIASLGVATLAGTKGIVVAEKGALRIALRSIYCDAPCFSRSPADRISALPHD